MGRRRSACALLAAPLLVALGTVVVPAGSAAALTFTVDTLDDTVVVDAVTSLREAVLEANATPGPDVIEFDPAVFDPAGPTQTITLDSELIITDDLTIIGPGRDLLNVVAPAPALPALPPIATIWIDGADAALTVTDLEINGSGGHGIAVGGNEAPVVLERVRITGSDRDGVLLVPFAGFPTPPVRFVGAVRVLDSDLSDNSGAGLAAVAVGAIDIDRSIANDNGAFGWYLDEANGLTMDMVTASDNGLDNLYAFRVGDISITDGAFDRSVTADGIEIESVGRVDLTRVDASGNEDDGIEINGFAPGPGPEEPIGPVVAATVTTEDNGENGVDVEFATSVDLTDITSNRNGPTTSDDGIGIGVDVVRGPVTISDSILEGNSGVWGGGLFVSEADGAVTVTDVRIVDNSALADGGGALLQFNAAGSTLTRVDVIGNRTLDPAGFGGAGILSDAGDLTIIDSTIDSNIAADQYGGLIAVGDPTDPFSLRVADSTISSNTATGADGGLATLGVADAEIVNSTITDNSATDGAAGVGVRDGAMRVRHSTISGNVATSEAAVLAVEDATLQLDHTISSGNTGDEFEEAGTNTVGADRSYLGGDAAVGLPGTGNTAGDTPMLDALADNGGRTLTMRPGSGSPVVGAGDPAIVGAPATDQRGAARVLGTIDIGAVEIDVGQLDISPTATTVAEDAGTVTLTVTRTGAGEGVVSAVVTTTDRTAIAPGDYTAVSAPLLWADGETGAKTVTVNVSTDDETESDETFTATIGSVVGGATVGASTATITITDTPPPTTTTTTTTTVPAVNRPPVIGPVQDQILTPGATGSVIVTVTDLDGDPIVLTAAADDPSVLSEVAATEVTGGSSRLAVPFSIDRVFRVDFTSAGVNGTSGITLVASDGAATDSGSFDVRVIPAVLPATGARSGAADTTPWAAIAALLTGVGLVGLSRRRQV